MSRLFGGDTRPAVAAASAFVLVTVALSVGFVAPASATAGPGPSVPLQVDNTSNATVSTSTPTSSTTENWSAPGPFTIEDLRTGGRQVATEGSQGPPPSTRLLDTGGIVLKYLPVNPIQTQYQPLEKNQKIGTNQLLARTSAFGNSTGEYELVVVYWKAETTTVNDSQRTYAANQSVQRISFNAPEGYSASQLKLNPHIGEAVQATAWLEKNGERVSGARWRFTHETNPLTASPAYPTNSKGDLWRWGALTLMLPAIGGILVSGTIARHILSRTVVGSLKGMGYWALVVAVLIGIATAITTWQTSIILANAPYAVGLLMGLLALPVMLSIRDADLSKSGFFQRHIHRDAVSPEGEETVGTRRVTNKIKQVYQQGDTLYAPVSGIRPMLARYWADPAAIPTEEWKSYDSGEGDLDQLFEVDPEADEVLVHKPARLDFAPSFFVDVDEEELEAGPESDGIGSLPAAISTSLSNLSKQINWRTVSIAVGGGALVYLLTMGVFGAPLIAMAAALIPFIVDSYTPRDGSLEVEWGPSHWNDVQAQVQTEREEYNERKTYDALLQSVANLEWGHHENAEKMVDRVKTKIQEALDDEHGGNQSPSASEPSSSSPETGVADD